VTDTAIFRGGQVIGVFAPRGNAIVAGRAVAHDTGVIKHRTNKGGRVMAHTAILRRNDMGTRFANSCGAVMTTGAIAGDAIMIEDRGTKRCCVMAEMTILCRRHMVYRRILTGGIDPIVTAGTVVGHTV